MKSAPQASLQAASVVYGGVLVNVIVTILLGYSVAGNRLRPTWVLVMPAAQIALGVGVLLWWGRSRANSVHVAIATFAIFAWLRIYLIGEPGRLAFGTLDGAIHLVLPLAWLFAVGGLLIAPLCLRRRWFGFLRFWLVVSAMLGTAELGCRILVLMARDQDQYALDLPKDFPEPDDVDEIHIAAIGGSSTLGHPYQPKFGFPQVFLWRLEQHYPDRKFVLHNLAIGGFNLRKAAGELHKLKLRPHFLLIYSGHNEFYNDIHESNEAPLSWDGIDPWMRWSALFRRIDPWVTNRRNTWKFRFGDRQLFDHAVVSPQSYEARLARFKSQCEELSRFCREQKIAPVWFVPAASESGFEPNRSVRPLWLSQKEAVELTQELEVMRAGDCEAAIPWYRDALKRLPEFAEFHFGLARCLEETGDFESARDHYGRALDCDGFPIRAQEGYREAIRQTAESSDQLCIETSEFLRQYAPGRILGTDLFHDNVHMTLKGYYLTGLAGAEALVESRRLESEVGLPDEVEPMSLGQAIERAGLDREDLAEAYRLTAYGFDELKGWRYDWSLREGQFSMYQRLADALAEGLIAPGQEGTESLDSPFVP